MNICFSFTLYSLKRELIQYEYSLETRWKITSLWFSYIPILLVKLLKCCQWLLCGLFVFIQATFWLACRIEFYFNIFWGNSRFVYRQNSQNVSLHPCRKNIIYCKACLFMRLFHMSSHVHPTNCKFKLYSLSHNSFTFCGNRKRKSY